MRGEKNGLLLFKLYMWKNKKISVYAKMEQQGQGVFSYLKHKTLHKQQTMWNDNVQDIGYQTRKGSDPWDTWSKQGEPYDYPLLTAHTTCRVCYRGGGGVPLVGSGASPKWRNGTGSPENAKWLEFTGQNTGEERAALRRHFGDPQGFTILCMRKLPKARDRPIQKDYRQQ